MKFLRENEDQLHSQSMLSNLWRGECNDFWKEIKALLLLLLKNVSSARQGESDIHPISPKTPAPHYQPIDRKKRKGKRVEDYSRDTEKGIIVLLYYKVLQRGCA